MSLCLENVPLCCSHQVGFRFSLLLSSFRLSYKNRKKSTLLHSAGGRLEELVKVIYRSGRRGWSVHVTFVRFIEIRLKQSVSPETEYPANGPILLQWNPLNFHTGFYSGPLRFTACNNRRISAGFTFSNVRRVRKLAKKVEEGEDVRRRTDVTRTFY